MKVRAANGYYLPSCFFMFIDSIEIENCIDDNEQTFVHEYVHFLQDIIFPYNIRYNLTENRKFNYLSCVAQVECTINRPFNLWDDDTKLTDRQFEYTWGGAEFINEAGKIEKITSDHFVMHTGARVFKYEIYFDDGKLYRVGARDLVEYIAHKIESSKWKTNSPDLPYRTVDLLFDYYCYDFADDVRVCIVEYCMFNDDPMHSLYLLLNNDIKSSKTKFLEYSSCQEFLLQLDWNSIGTGHDSIKTKSERRWLQLKDSLIDKFKYRFESICDWIQFIVNYSSENFSERFIFSELLRMSNDNFFNSIGGYVSDLGIPLVFNKNHQAISLLPIRFDQNQFLQLFAMYGFMEYVYSTSLKCPLFDFCSNNDSKIMSEYCSTNPIKQAEKVDLCPMGQFLKAYGFQEISWA